jgi:iron complex transport system ATP-binding protein
VNFLEINELSVGYGKKMILQNISFSAPQGTLNGIIGANGCGKTTALKAICGILPHEGACMLDGVSLEKLSAKGIAKICSYIPQRSGISIELSALDVVLMGFNPKLGLLEHPNSEMKRKAGEALRAVGLGERENDDFLTLSEGQKQLCILARTLVSDAKLLLLDEPESALDFRFRYQMLNILKKWIAEGEKTALITLHDGNLALNFCDRLFVIANGGLVGVISPRTDSAEKMESLLREVYGNISLTKCRNRKGNGHWIILNEDI